MRGVVVRLDAGALDQRIAAVEELAHVAAEVLPEHKLSARVQFLVSVQVEHQVVKDHERKPRSHALVDLLRGKHHHVAASLVAVVQVGGLHHHRRLPIRAPVAALTDQHQQAEGKQADHAHGSQ